MILSCSSRRQHSTVYVTVRVMACAIRPTRKNIDGMPAAAAEPACGLAIRLVSSLPGPA